MKTNNDKLSLIKPDKEPEPYLVYILPTFIDGHRMSGYDLDDWKYYEETMNQLEVDCISFIKYVIDHGKVLSIHEFMNWFNIEEDYDCWIYITDKYEN